eukprot:scaffold587894_cov24-Prasinocladus_malaysianus.AAC.2
MSWESNRYCGFRGSVIIVQKRDVGRVEIATTAAWLSSCNRTFLSLTLGRKVSTVSLIAFSSFHVLYVLLTIWPVPETASFEVLVENSAPAKARGIAVKIGRFP